MDPELYLPMRVSNVQADRMSARIPAANGTILGSWWTSSFEVMAWGCEAIDVAPNGHITLSPVGTLNLHFGDAAGWRPFISVAGPAAGTVLHASMRYAFSGNVVVDEVPLNFDETLKRHVGVGSVCDGSLSTNSQLGGISLGWVSGREFGIDDIVFGYVQLGDG
jgi:hypothetical protein